jgi:hypothetical protein
MRYAFRGDEEPSSSYDISQYFGASFLNFQYSISEIPEPF